MEKIEHCSSSRDNQWVIYSSWSEYVHLSNTSGEHQTHEALDFKPTAARFCLFSIQFSPDNREILGGSSDYRLYIYDLERRARKECIVAHKDDVNAVAFADKSSQILFSGSDDSTVKVWDRRAMGSNTNGCVGIFPGHVEGITFLDSKLDGRYLISNSKDQTIKLWDLRAVKGCDFHYQGKISNFSYNSYTSRRQLEEIKNRKTHQKDDCSIMTYRGHEVLQTLIRCRFSPLQSTGQKYIYTGSFNGRVYVYDIITGEIVQVLHGHEGTVRDVHWHPWKPLLVSTCWDGKIIGWNHDPEVKGFSPPPVASRALDDEVRGRGRGLVAPRGGPMTRGRGNTNRSYDSDDD